MNEEGMLGKDKGKRKEGKREQGGRKEHESVGGRKEGMGGTRVKRQ